MAIIYKVVAAVIQPLGDVRLANAVASMGGFLMQMFAVLSIVGVMFFLFLAIVVGMSNITMMMR
jgi:stage III sporulation protein AE